MGRWGFSGGQLLFLENMTRLGEEGTNVQVAWTQQALTSFMFNLGFIFYTSDDFSSDFNYKGKARRLM